MCRSSFTLLVPLALALLLMPPSDDAARAGEQKSIRVGDVIKTVTIEAALDDTDANDTKMNNPCKRYSVRFLKSQTYTIDLISGDFDAFLRVEDATGTELAFDDDSGGNLNSRLRFNPPQNGPYILVATRLGQKNGKFTLKITPDHAAAAEEPGRTTAAVSKNVVIDEDELNRRPTLYRAGRLPAGLPDWFAKLDTDSDGQVALWEWRKGGRPLDEFAEWDLDEDGFITVDEVLRKLERERQAASRAGQAPIAPKEKNP